MNHSLNNHKLQQAASSYHQSSRSEFKLGHQLKSMRKIAPFSNEAEDILKLVHDLDLECNSFQTVYDAAFRFRKFSSRADLTDEVINSGAVQYFVQYLNPKNIEKYCQVKKTSNEPIDPSKTNVITLRQFYAMQLVVTWCITNIVGGTSEHTKYIVEMGCVPLLINLMASEDREVRRQCAWAIGNIAVDSESMRNYLIDCGVMKHLVELVETDDKFPTKGNAVWTISSLLRGKQPPDWGLVDPAVPLLCQLILNHGLDEEILSEACWTLSYTVSNGPPHVTEYITKQENTIRRLMELLKHTNPSIQTPALRTIGLLVTGNNEQTQRVVSCEVLPCLKTLLLSPKEKIRKEVMWSLSNITAGTTKQIQQVIDAEIFSALFKMLSDNNEAVDVKNEMYFVFTNALLDGSDAQIQYLIDQGVIQHLCGGLDVGSNRPDYSIILNVLLNGLQAVLRCGVRSDTLKEIFTIIEDCGGVEKIKALQHHTSEDVNQKALQILELYERLNNNEDI